MNDELKGELWEYRFDYWKVNVMRYAALNKIPIQHAATDLNREVSDLYDPFSIEFIEEQARSHERWIFITGLLLGIGLGVGVMMCLYAMSNPN